MKHIEHTLSMEIIYGCLNDSPLLNKTDLVLTMS